MSFLDARTEAIRWSHEGETVSARPRVRSCVTDVLAVQCSAYNSSQFSSKSTN